MENDLAIQETTKNMKRKKKSQTLFLLFCGDQCELVEWIIIIPEWCSNIDILQCDPFILWCPDHLFCIDCKFIKLRATDVNNWFGFTFKKW